MDTAQMSPDIAPADPRNAFESAFQTFVTALQDAGPSLDAQTRAADAYRAYAELIEQFWSSEPVRARAVEAQEAYMRALHDALSPEPVRARARAAFRDYVRVTREAWLQINPNEVDPALIAAIGHTMMYVATLAAEAEART